MVVGLENYVNHTSHNIQTLGVPQLAMKLLALASIVLLQQTGCDQTPVQTMPAPHLETIHYQRFVPIPRSSEILGGVPWSGSVALDTMTGQMCRTYDMKLKNWESIPLCIDLYVAGSR